MDYWICRDGTKMTAEEMTDKHIFKAWLMFQHRKGWRANFLEQEAARRNLDLPGSLLIYNKKRDLIKELMGAK